MSSLRSEQLLGAALAVAALAVTAGCAGGEQPADRAAVEQGPIELPAPSESLPVQNSLSAPDPVADLEIEDQSGDGSEVTVTSVSLGRESAILVITDLAGDILAVKKVSPRTQPVVVPLSQGVTSSQELVATLYLDNGNGDFDPAADTPMVDEEGEPVSEDFDYVIQ